jgi:formylglycine-generating enzyme required for sulfatase activity
VNPQHPVTVSSFLLHRYCVTNVEYELFAPRHQFDRCWRRLYVSLEEMAGRDDRYPAADLSWYDAACFAKWLGEITHAGIRQRVVLPSEARWEYGCRCGETTPFTFDLLRDGKSCQSGDCNFDERWSFPFRGKQDEGRCRGHTIPVDQGVPNRWGFFHMHGNVREWCADWYAPGFYRSKAALQVDPENKEGASFRVLRGGSFERHRRHCRSAFRDLMAPASAGDTGLRLAAVPNVGAEPGQASGA